MRITIIATGFDNNGAAQKKPVVEARPAVKPEPPVKKPRASADEELDRLMMEFGTPKKKKINH